MTTPAVVKRGADFLDERVPGWRLEVDADTLDLSHSCGCVLGQVFGEFARGESLLGLTNAQARRLGFLSSARMRYDQLTEAWRQVLNG